MRYAIATIRHKWYVFLAGLTPGQMKGNTFGILYFARETLENTQSASFLRRSDWLRWISYTIKVTMCV